MQGFIYKITNEINDKVYVGQTRKSLEQRFKKHISDCIHLNESRPLYNAMRKYGIDKFHIELIEECPEEELNDKERYWIEKYNSYHCGYNATLGGDGNKKFNYDFILYLLLEGKTLEEIKEIVECGKDTIYTVANLNNLTISEKSTKKIEKTVYQYDKQENYLRAFLNPHDAMKWCVENGYSSNLDITAASSHIKATCNGKRKSAYGFIWRYDKLN